MDQHHHVREAVTFIFALNDIQFIRINRLDNLVG